MNWEKGQMVFILEEANFHDTNRKPRSTSLEKMESEDRKKCRQAHTETGRLLGEWMTKRRKKRETIQQTVSATSKVGVLIRRKVILHLNVFNPIKPRVATGRLSLSHSLLCVCTVLREIIES